MVLRLTLHLLEPGCGSIASAGGSGVIGFAAATLATEARNAGLPAFDVGSSSCHNRGSNSVRDGHANGQDCCFCYGRSATVILSGGRGAVERPPLRLGPSIFAVQRWRIGVLSDKNVGDVSGQGPSAASARSGFAEAKIDIDL